MIENFNTGFIFGFFFVLSSILVFLVIILMLENKRKDKFLVQIDSWSEYVKWKKNGGN